MGLRVDHASFVILGPLAEFSLSVAERAQGRLREGSRSAGRDSSLALGMTCGAVAGSMWWSTQYDVKDQVSGYGYGSAGVYPRHG
jgi:hypothetical protein